MKTLSLVVRSVILAMLFTFLHLSQAVALSVQTTDGVHFIVWNDGSNTVKSFTLQEIYEQVQLSHNPYWTQIQIAAWESLKQWQKRVNK